MVGVMEHMSLEGKGSEGEKVFLEFIRRFKTSQEDVGRKEERGGGVMEGKIKGELGGIIVE